MLQKYIQTSELTYEEVAKKLDIPLPTLYDICKKRSPNTRVITVMKIKKLTGLDPWQYLDKIAHLKPLNK